MRGSPNRSPAAGERLQRPVGRVLQEHRKGQGGRGHRGADESQGGRSRSPIRSSAVRSTATRTLPTTVLLREQPEAVPLVEYRKKISPQYLSQGLQNLLTVNL